MLRKLAIAICALGLAAGGLMLSTPAQAQGIKVGVLTCNVASGFGFIFGSSRAINCTFSPTGTGGPDGTSKRGCGKRGAPPNSRRCGSYPSSSKSRRRV